MNEATLGPLLAGSRLIVVTGKGGTGKSAVSAALAAALAGPRRRVWLLEADPRESLHTFFGRPPSGGRPVRVSDHLILQNLSPIRVLDETVRLKLRIGPLVRRVLASPVYRTFVEAAPGLRETAILGRAYRLLRGRETEGEPTPHTVILDAPATGHGLAALTAPSLLARTLGGGPVGQMAAAIATLVEDRKATAVVAVSTAEEMPVTETLELAAESRRLLGRSPAAVVLNRLLPEDDPAACGLGPEATAFWRRRLQVQEAEARRLRSSWDGPMLRLPLVPRAPGPALTRALAAALDGAAP